MGRQRSPNREAAFDLFKNSGGTLTCSAIAAQLGEKLNNITNWRAQDKWKDRIGKVGAPYGNQNGIGNSGGGAPRGNQNNYIYGFYSKYYPKEVVSILELTEGMEPIEILWVNIQTKFAAIIRAQKIMYVKDQDDMTKEIKKTKREFGVKKRGTGEDVEFVPVETYREDEYEIQFAWDKQANFLKAQSVAMGQLTNMIKRYEEMLHANWDTATEEQKLRVERLRVNINSTKTEIKHKRKVAEEKLQLAKDRFEHTKDIDGKRYW